jgi:hypothetical protein
MCFSSSKTTTPAAAPAAPDPVAEQQDVGKPREAEDAMVYGTIKAPTLRVDRSVSAGGSTSGGTGLTL